MSSGKRSLRCVRRLVWEVSRGRSSTRSRRYRWWTLCCPRKVVSESAAAVSRSRRSTRPYCSRSSALRCRRIWQYTECSVENGGMKGATEREITPHPPVTAEVGLGLPLSYQLKVYGGMPPEAAAEKDTE